jgi:hypothetical protein
LQEPTYQVFETEVSLKEELNLSRQTTYNDN